MTVNFFCAIILLSCAIPTEQAAKTGGKNEGTVFGITGRWTCNGKDIGFGGSVSLGATISGAGSGSILIVFEDKSRIFKLCEKELCEYSLSEKDTKTSSLTSQLIAAVQPYFRHEPQKFVEAVSRSLKGDLQEAIVQIQEERLDLTPAFQNMIAGNYWLKLQPLTGSDRTIGPLAFEWKPGLRASVPVAGVKPGIYRLSLVEGSGESTGIAAWILVSAPKDYPNLSTAFREAKRVTETWSGETDPGSIRAVLRAYLQSLSEQKTQ